MDSAQDSYKKWGIALIIFLLILIPAEIALTRPNAIKNLRLKFQTSFSEKPKVRVIPKEEVAAVFTHPALYFVDLEYDPLKDKAVKIDSGKSNGDPEILSPTPSSSSEKFSYKVEVISSQGNLLSSGWISRYKMLIATEQNTYKFRASGPYEKGETINIFSTNGKKLWEEKVND